MPEAVEHGALTSKKTDQVFGNGKSVFEDVVTTYTGVAREKKGFNVKMKICRVVKRE